MCFLKLIVGVGVGLLLSSCANLEPIPKFPLLPPNAASALLKIHNVNSHVSLTLDGYTIAPEWPIPEYEYKIRVSPGNHHVRYFFVTVVDDYTDSGGAKKTKQIVTIDWFFNCEEGKTYTAGLWENPHFEIRKGLLITYKGWSIEETASFPKFLKVSTK